MTMAERRELWDKSDNARMIWRREEHQAKQFKPCSADYHKHMKLAKEAKKEYEKIEKLLGE